MMKIVVVSLCFAMVALSQEQYDSSNDNYDISEVLKNDRLMIAYSKCLLNKGPCTAEVKQVKEKLPEALATRCAKCTEKQKQLAKQLYQELNKKHPDILAQLTTLYDPDGKHRESFKDFLKA